MFDDDDDDDSEMGVTHFQKKHIKFPKKEYFINRN